MKNTRINSSPALVAILVAVAVSTAFVVSLSAVASATIQANALDQFNERKNNGYHQSISTQHQSSGPHLPSLIANSDDLNQTMVTELRIALHDLWVEHIVWTRQ